MNDITAYASLGADINKRKGDTDLEVKSGVVSEKLPELTLDMKNEDIVKLTTKWAKEWNDSSKKQEWEKQIEENEKYWLGKHFDTPAASKDRPFVDNLIFEALETYLPQATRRNPEPLVELHPAEVGEDGSEDPAKQKYVTKVKNKLSYLADENKLRLKLKKGARHWAIYQLGVAKFGWDLDRDIPVVRIVRPKKIILDPEATIDEDGYNGDRVGEHRKLSASKILAIMGKDAEKDAKEKIMELAKDNEATQIQFIEWWTNEYMCWQLGDKILLKKKNPHWNYDQTIEDTQVDDYGDETPTTEEKPGINHLASPRMPYSFLTVFNLGDQPMDKTSLIGQNIANQDKINKRNRQIDKNVDRMNGGMVISLERSGLTESQAKKVSDALKKGGTVLIPSGSARDAVDTYSPNGIPGDVYNDLVDTRSRTRDIFGIRGSSAAGLESEDTVRGKILNKGTDTDRIGGGVTEYLEQWADDWYNWMLQLLYVYDAGFQFLGGGVPPQVRISVKEGSLLPKDSTSLANQAIELATANKLSTIDLFKRLEYPNPEELAANMWLEVNAPHILYKDNPLVQEALAMQAQQAQMEAEQQAQESAQKEEGETNRMVMKGDMDMQKEAMKLAAKPTPSSVLAQVPAQGP